MRRVQRSVLLPHPPRQVFALVNDIDRYAEFLPWCVASEVLHRDAGEVTGRIEIDAHGHRETLVTRNELVGQREIRLTLLEGPFHTFDGCWLFTPLGKEGSMGCKVQLDLAFEFTSRLLSLAAGPFIDRIADRLVDAFAARAASDLTPQEPRHSAMPLAPGNRHDG